MINREVKYLLKNVLKFGIIYGLIGIVSWLIVYERDISWFYHPAYFIITLLIFIGYFILAGKNYRKKLGDRLDFKEGFLFVWLAMVVYGTILFLFNITMYKVIDPSLPQLLAEGQVRFTLMIASIIGFSQEIRDKIERKILEAALEQFKISNLVINYFFTLGLYALGALIIARFIKRG